MSANDEPKVRILGPKEGEPVNVLGAEVRIKSGGDSRHVLVADHAVPAGYGVPFHVHDAEDEAFFVLEGEVTFECDEGVAHLGPGGFIHLPRGCHHSFRNETQSPARMLVIGSPGGGLHGLMQGLNRAGAEAGGMPALATIGAVAAENGIRLG
jgi:mannose-6-phosphate isomerase-like protein (cupin superfamily)